MKVCEPGTFVEVENYAASTVSSILGRPVEAPIHPLDERSMRGNPIGPFESRQRR